MTRLFAFRAGCVQSRLEDHMKYMVVMLLLLMLVGCSSGESFFRLEEYGEGWKLNIKDDGETFKASWIKGENLSAKLVGYSDASNANYYILNTLYLELDEDGKVVNGRLKRVVLPEFEKRTYYEQNAQWFRVLEGRCTLNAQLEGTVEVRCEGGYEFNGSVEPMNDIVITRPEE